MTLLTLAACGDAGMPPGDRSVRDATPGSTINRAIAAASSPAEDLIEAALDRDRSRAEERLSALAAAWGAKELPPEVRDSADLGRRLTEIREAVSAGAWQSAGLASVEAYRALVAHQDDAALEVPVSASLLDYSGFKLAVLTMSPEVDWEAVGSAIAETRDFWSRTRGSVEDTGLRDLMDSVAAGLADGLEARNRLAVEFGGQVTLDTVDLLEQYFTGPGPGRAVG